MTELSRLQPRMKARSVNAYRSTCKVCKCGIYVGQPTAWRTATPIGLIHEECA